MVTESTSDYWKPFYYLLDDGLDVMLVNAGEVRNLPGVRPRAKRLWAQANAVSPWTGRYVSPTTPTVTRSRSTRWATAARMCSGSRRSIMFAQIRTQITDRTIGTAFRDGWQGDYPSTMEFLEPLFVTGAGSNDVDCSHPAFDAALTAAEAAPALPESCALTNAALRVLLRDMPVVPLWDYISAAARLRAHRQRLT